MRTAQRAFIVVSCVSSAMFCLAVDQGRMFSETAYAAKEIQPLFGLRGTISPVVSDLPDGRLEGRNDARQQTSFSVPEILRLAASAKTTNEVRELYSSILAWNPGLFDQDSAQWLRDMFAAEIGRRQGQGVDLDVAQPLTKEHSISRTEVASFVMAGAAGLSALGIWFSGYFNRKNYLHTVAKDRAAAIDSSKIACPQRV